MNNDYWIAKWRDGNIGFHRDTVNPKLEAFGPAAFGSNGCRILVPMCGKSLDLLWLERRGHEVVGIELVEQAITTFFQEHGHSFEVSEEKGIPVFRSGKISILQADIFDLPADLPPPAEGIYDRAAYHAIETPARRRRYAQILARRLLPDGALLLLSIEFDQAQMAGPPFAVSEEEVRQTFGSSMNVHLLHRQEIIGSEPRLQERGCTSCLESVYMLRKVHDKKGPDAG